MNFAEMLVSESNNLYTFQHFLETLLKEEAEGEKTRLQSVGYYEDVSLVVTDPKGRSEGSRSGSST